MYRKKLTGVDHHASVRAAYHRPWPSSTEGCVRLGAVLQPYFDILVTEHMAATITTIIGGVPKMRLRVVP